MTTVAEREELKKRLIELAESDPDFVNTLIIDVRNELKRRKWILINY
jgi:hypothetical protein